MVPYHFIPTKEKIHDKRKLRENEYIVFKRNMKREKMLLAVFKVGDENELLKSKVDDLELII